MSTVREAIEHFRNGRLPEAEALYQRVLAAQPNDADALHYLGVLRYSQKRSEEAIALVSRALKAAPRNADAWNSLGNILSGTGKLAPAEFAFKSAIELRPAFGEAWYNLAILQRRMRKREEALASFRRVVEIDPQIPNAHESIALMLILLRRPDEAGEAFRRWSEADPENPIARHMVAAYAHQAPARAEDAYVAKLFDRMSAHFDASLANLKYAAPQLLTAALSEFLPFGEKRLAVLDAGCGTGLCGPLLRSSSRQLVGVDLSAGMLDKARERNVYDELHEAELVAFMHARPAAYDLVISADTLVYFGELEGAFAGAAMALRPNGILGFTVEAEPPGSREKYRLNEHGRYSHGADYLRQSLASAGFSVLQLEGGVLRMERGSEVQGHVVVARKSPGP